MTWLKKTARRKGVSGSTLLEEYAGDSESWYLSVEELGKNRIEDWIFCRGSLSDVEIANARTRYLSQYVFVAGDKCSQSFVDALLLAEHAQISMRINASSHVSCSRCVENERQIRQLSAALSAREIKSSEDVELAALVSVFQRYYMLGEGYAMKRIAVRKKLETIIRREICDAQRILPHGKVWHRFLSEVINQPVHIIEDIPCRLRQPPITLAEYSVEIPAIYKDLS